MTEQDHDRAEQSNGQGEAAPHKADKRTFATAAEARAAGPVLESQQLYGVNTGDGTTFCWARHTGQAFLTVATARGWKAARVTDAKDKAAALLEAMDPEERAALLAQFGGAGKGKGKK